MVTTDLGPARDQIYKLRKGLQVIKQNIVTDIRNALVKDQRSINKALLESIRASESTITYLSKEFDTLYKEKGQSKKSKRAFEVLGSFLLTITGVPSARDHRKLLQQIGAIRFENKGIEALLVRQNQQSQKLLERMHYHQTLAIEMTSSINNLANNTAKLASNLHKAFSLIAVNSKIMNSVTEISYIIQKAKSITAKSDEGLISREALPMENLVSIIDQIHIKRKADSPIFSREECHHYYSLKLAHSWAEPTTMKLYTLLQVPIAAMNEIQTIHVLDHKNKYDSSFPLAVLNKQSNTYRYLSLADYVSCVQVTQAKLCQKRRIEINPQIGCSLRLMNCKVWVSDLVHDLSNSEILIASGKARNATISCNKAPTRTCLLYTSPSPRD